MHNVDLFVEDGLEFVELPHKRLGNASSSLDSGDLVVGKEFSTIDGFIVVVKRYNIKNGVWIQSRRHWRRCIVGGTRRTTRYGCGRFDRLRFLCVHATCSSVRLDPMRFVDEFYKLVNMYNVWRNVFPLVPDERRWSPISSTPFKLLLDTSLRQKPKSRPISTWILTIWISGKS
ncbi:hypothetical protein PVK06_020360 [Gossypium arboreum]|uniref:Uncharacterized protein n=1 Tax=Gossypium arboreum TaxID=29729 RepID=A0ABR0PM52_GOSAR|nr:hypothetical protein PVK06_020360 [Gossypium arboreum]